uniref:Uncharacterized protein n=1 Tax=uncultured Chloroflexota bacterium TaxID=166587 RepID=H5SMX4_9CHLR|nr:hypothetical protein HGMM_F51C01C30 [uncultured Chloroflexota bacterium]
MNFRRLGGCVFLLIAGVLLALMIGFAISTFLQHYQAWWISFPYGIPLLAISLAIAVALFSGQRVRPALGMWLLIAALWYSLLFLFAVVALSWFACLYVLPLWPLVVVPMVGAGWLLRGQHVRYAPWLFAGISICWILAFIAILFIIVPIDSSIELADALAIAFFFVPALLALLFAWWSS